MAKRIQIPRTEIYFFNIQWVGIALIILIIIVYLGTIATKLLKQKAIQEIIDESEAADLTLSVYLNFELNKIDEAVSAITNSPIIATTLISRKPKDIMQLEKRLNKYGTSFGAAVIYVSDRKGNLVASSSISEKLDFEHDKDFVRSKSLVALKGNPVSYFIYEERTGRRSYFSNYPVRNEKGRIIGIVTIKKYLDSIETFFQNYPYSFFIDPDGIVFLTSRPEMLLRSMWPLDEDTFSRIVTSGKYGQIKPRYIFPRMIIDHSYESMDGKNYFIVKKKSRTDGWAIVLLTETTKVKVYQLIGVIITVSVCLFALIFFAIIIGINESRKIIKQSETLYKTLTENSFTNVYVIHHNKFLFMNPKALAVTGYTWEEIQAINADTLVHPADKADVIKNSSDMLLGIRTNAYEYRIITKQGKISWIMENVAHIIYERKEAILGNSVDITERKKMEEEIKTLSITDHLTGILNRRGFLVYAEQMLKEENRLKRWLRLIYVDLDGLKHINDRFGHKAGDDMIIEAVEILKESFRVSDVIARIGGDEFVVLARENLSSSEDRILERIQKRIDLHNQIEGRIFHIDMSVGTVTYDPDNPVSIDELITRADAMMYEQKKRKRAGNT